MTMLWVELGLSEEVKRVSEEQLLQIYNEYMGKLEQECVADLTELFLERSDLFDQISASTNDTFSKIHQELKVGCVFPECIHARSRSHSTTFPFRNTAFTFQ